MSSSAAGLTDIGKSDDDVNSGSQQMNWRDRIEISIAKCRKIRGSNYVQLATVDQGEPRCRTVVFRGFLSSDSSTMKMITDGRSNKVEEAKTNPSAELVWWFPKTSEQYRVRGRLVFLGADATEHEEVITRKQTWGNLSDPAREQFYWVRPGTSFGTENEATHVVPTGGRSEEGKVLNPPDSFLIMLLEPTRVDYLCLRDNYRQIDSLMDGSWKFEHVNP